MIKRILAFLILVSYSAFAVEVEDIKARKGLEISGTVRSASFNSNFESPNENPSSKGVFSNTMPSHEIAEFVQIDLNFKFRPWDAITANLDLRLGAGAQEYFAAAATTVNTPWMNIEGNLGEDFYWVVGDFRQSYSPLTLYMPGIDIMYEPVAFARKREMAQKEALLQGNQRNLQGFNLQYRPQLGETLGELRVEALGARLRRAGYLDASGAMGNILPNEGIAGATQAGRFDKFLFAGNLELLPLNKNVLIGATYMKIADDKGSSKYYSCPDCELSDFDKDSLLNTLDSLPQNTSVIAGRAGADIAEILGISSLVANLTAELAMSSDDVDGKQEDGKAVLVQMDLGYKGIANVILSSSFIRNDSAWFNNVAQSPSFFARRILNSDKDVGCNSSGCMDQTFNLSKYGVYSPLYSTFDALYFFTPKHSPINVNLTPGEPEKSAQTISYANSPYTKTSWNPSVFTRAELALLEYLSDLNLQMALPNGFATSNRVGFQEVLTANWQELVEVKGLYANYEQMASDAGSRPAKFTEFGGGAKVDVFGVELSGSYKHSAKEQEWRVGGTTEYNSNFINAGIYYRFFKRFGLTLGYQKIDSDLNAEAALRQSGQAEKLGLKVKIVPVVQSAQNQWMAGLDYTIAPHAWFSVNYGIMNVENTYSLNETGEILNTNLPGYLVVDEVKTKELKHEFSRNILEATVNVEF